VGINPGLSQPESALSTAASAIECASPASRVEVGDACTWKLRLATSTTAARSAFIHVEEASREGVFASVSQRETRRVFLRCRAVTTHGARGQRQSRCVTEPCRLTSCKRSQLQRARVSSCYGWCVDNVTASVVVRATLFAHRRSCDLESRFATRAKKNVHGGVPGDGQLSGAPFFGNFDAKRH
jgi:hypothetical protein